MERVTIFALVLAVLLLLTENPVSDVEMGGFPLGYYWSFILLAIAFEMRSRIIHERTR